MELEYNDDEQKEQFPIPVAMGTTPSRMPPLGTRKFSKSTLDHAHGAKTFAQLQQMIMESPLSAVLHPDINDLLDENSEVDAAVEITPDMEEQLWGNEDTYLREAK